MPKLYKYLVAGDIIQWVGFEDDHPKIVTKGKLEEVVVAKNEHEACDKLAEKFVKEYGKVEYADIDDIRCHRIGPADVFLSATIDMYTPKIGDTITVGELIEYLEHTFDPASRIYLANYSGIVPVYGDITEDKFGYEEDNH